MRSPQPKLRTTGRFGRIAAVMALSGAMLAGTAGAALAATVGNNPGAVTLNPTDGPTNSKPTWSTEVGCKPGFQGSAVFREVHADGVTTNSISQAVNSTDINPGVVVPFSGTLQATMAQIQAAGGIANGATQELVVICFSGPGLTGTSDPEMDTFVYYDPNGTYSTDHFVPVPVGEVGGIALAGLAAIGLWWMQFRRLRSRRAPSAA